MEQQQQAPPQQELTEEEALIKMAQLMKDNAPIQEDKHNVHVFLTKVAEAPDTTKTGNLRDDKDLNELGIPAYTVRGAKEMSLIAEMIMDNDYFMDYFKKDAENTLATSLSREGFLVKQATVQTKVVADATRRRKINKELFGSKRIEESGGDPNQSR